MTPQDQEFSLFSLLHGETSISPLLVAQIPSGVAKRLGWKSRSVFLTTRDAQKIRHHPMHGMDAVKGLKLPLVVRYGDYYRSDCRGTELQIEIVLHQQDNSKRAFFLVLSRNKEDTGLFIRTFYFASEMSRNKMKSATKLLMQSTINYFK